MVIDRLRLTNEGQRDPQGIGPGHHYLWRKWCKNYLVSGLRRVRRALTVLRPLLNHLNLSIPVISLQNTGSADHYRLWVEPCGPTKEISTTCKKRGSRIITYCKVMCYTFGQLQNRVPMVSQWVRVASKRVAVASKVVPVASRQVPIGSVVARRTGFGGGGSGFCLGEFWFFGGGANQGFALVLSQSSSGSMPWPPRQETWKIGALGLIVRREARKKSMRKST